MKKIRKMFKVVLKNLKIDIDSFNIRYSNIKLACPKVTMNEKNNLSPKKKVGGGGINILREEDNPTRSSC
jgi:hypothetical protein